MWKNLSIFLSLMMAYQPFALSDNDIIKKLNIPVEKYTLPNGLQVLLSEDHSTPFVAVNLWYHVGARHETLGKTGLAHLFEHKMFEGSRQVKNGQHFKILEDVGAAEINASTSLSRTNYYQKVPKNDLELALSLESSRMYFLDFDQKKLDEQRKVVLSERAQRFTSPPYAEASLKLWQSIFPASHPFHERIIGSVKDLEAATLKDAQDFYDRFYGPSNATLALVGDFNKEQAKALINKYFGTLPRTKPVINPVMPKIVLDKEEIVTVEEKIGKLPYVSIVYITPALFKPKDAELDILAHILAGDETGRLTKAVKRDKALVSSVSVALQSMEDLSLFTIDAILNPGVNADAFIEETDRVLAELVSHPPTSAEVERAKNSILTNQFLSLQKLGGMGGRAELLQNYNWFAGNPDFIKQDSLRYSIDPKSLPAIAKEFLPPKKARKILKALPVSHQKGN